MSTATISSGATHEERGSTLILVLFLLLLTSFMGMSLLFNMDTDLQTSKSYSDRMRALADTDNALSEVIWRLNLTPGAGAAPVGSEVTVNDLVGYDASIRFDPNNLLGNEVDDDGDGLEDEPDELNLERDWTVRILLTSAETSPGTPYEVSDGSITAGPPWGSKLVVPTIQPLAGWRLYTSDDVSSNDALRLRFKLDTDTTLGDSEGDGAEIVFYDPRLPRDSHDDKTTLTGLGGDGDTENDSPYNITWSDGTTEYPATGMPVILVEAAARIRRADKTVARREIEAEIYQRQRRAVTKALCGCSDLVVTGGGTTDSYKSSQGDYGTGPVYENGSVGSNANMVLGGGAIVSGNAEATGSITFGGAGAAVMHDAIAGGSIDPAGTVLGERLPFELPLPLPCECGLIDVAPLLAAAQATNDNANIKPASFADDVSLRINAGERVILSGGTYYWDEIDITGGAAILVGVDSNDDGVVDGPPTEPVIIYCDGEMHLGGNGIINASKPTDLQIYATTSGTDNIVLNGGSEFRGMVYAPDAEVSVSGGLILKGAVLGMEVSNSGGAPVHFDEDLMEAYVINGQVASIAWREVK